MRRRTVPGPVTLRGRDARGPFRDGGARDVTEELRLVATKRQVAIVRSLTDELERCLARGSLTRGLRQQLADELARLGRGSLEAAAAMARPPTPVDDPSGVRKTLPVES
jgi:hypothetical protein